MGYNFKAPWKLAELERQDTSAVAQTTVSSSFRLLQPTGYCSVDLKLGNWSDLEDKLLGKFKDPGDYLMESSSSSGSSKRARVPSNGTQVPSCLVDGCVSDLSKCRDYHRRHKVCEQHSKTPKVFIKGQELRFCQQCSRFHSLVEFDEGKRSCRKRLDGHNRRRRKPQPDSLTVNSPSLFSHHQGITYLQFGSSQVHPTTTAGSTWARADKSESNPLLYNSQSSLNISVRKTHFPGSLSFSYKGEKHFPFLQDASSTVPGESGQSNLDANSTLANSGSSQNMFSDGLMQVIDSDCVLSLLSSPPANAREIGLSHMDMVQPDLTTPQAQSLIPSLNYDRLGAKGEPQLGSVLVSSGANKSSDIRGQNTFQTEGDVSSVSGSHQMISFSWG